MVRTSLVFILSAACLHAQKPADPETQFETEVRPVLAKRCQSCHNARSASGGLALDSYEGFKKGGTSGAPSPEAMAHALNGDKPYTKMPLGPKLPEGELQALQAWLSRGGHWPAPATTVSTAGKPSPAEDFWSLQPVRKPSPPTVRQTAWPRTDIDRFVLAKLEAEGLTPAPDADRRTLIRRAYFDLTGLPPAPEDVRAFLADESSNAFAKVVDKLLASPQYGERWARHWLDVARYADTSGDTADYPIPQAHLYRDWVIRAFNQDLPYNDFLRYQLAGDILAKTETDPVRYRDKTIATGFVALSRRFGNNKNDIHLTIEDTIDTLGRGVLGLTLRCARCHDHKFDPMSVRDYYGMYGIFASTRYPWAGASDSSFPSDMAFVSTDAKVRAEAEQRFNLLADYVRQINDNKYVTKPDRELYAGLTKKIAAAKAASEDTAALEKEREALLAKNAKFRLFLEKGIDWLKAERTRMAAQPLPCEVAFAVAEGKPVDAPVQLGGDPKRPGKLVPRQFVDAAWNRETHPLETTAGSGRLQLASWIADNEHPLTRRVFVNRIWQWHFGRGIVATPDNFGHRGERPVNPELLDYLASAFAEDGWSVKALHRRILLSRTYQLSSNWINANGEKDPGAAYLWRYPARRLEAEAIRDSMLAVSGQLDLSPGGAPPFLPWWEKRWNLNSPFHEVFDHQHRSVYLMTQRLFQHPFLELFDGADSNQTTSVRDRSQMATQALYLMNSPFMQARAAGLATRILAAPAADDRARVSQAFELAYGRPARNSELESSLAFLTRYRAGEPTHAIDKAWQALAWSMLSSNEFFFIP